MSGIWSGLWHWTKAGTKEVLPKAVAELIEMAVNIFTIKTTIEGGKTVKSIDPAAVRKHSPLSARRQVHEAQFSLILSQMPDKMAMRKIQDWMLTYPEDHQADIQLSVVQMCWGVELPQEQGMGPNIVNVLQVLEDLASMRDFGEMDTFANVRNLCKPKTEEYLGTRLVRQFRDAVGSSINSIEQLLDFVNMRLENAVNARQAKPARHWWSINSKFMRIIIR